MTSPHGCGKSQGGGRPGRECSLPSQRGPCLFPVRTCLGCGSSNRPRPLVPRFNGLFRDRPDAICQRVGDSNSITACVITNCQTSEGSSSELAARHATTASHGRLPRRNYGAAVRFDVAAEPPRGLRATSWITRNATVLWELRGTGCIGRADISPRSPEAASCSTGNCATNVLLRLVIEEQGTAEPPTKNRQ